MMETMRRALIVAATGNNYADGLMDSSGKYVFDNSNALIVCSDGAYQSAFTAAQIDSMITATLGA